VLKQNSTKNGAELQGGKARQSVTYNPDFARAGPVPQSA